MAGFDLPLGEHCNDSTLGVFELAGVFVERGGAMLLDGGGNLLVMGLDLVRVEI